MANFEQKDQQKRKLVRKFEVQRKFLKAVTQNQSLPQSLRYEYFLKLQKLAKKTSAVQVVNRCVFSHRSRGTLRKFKLSRIWLRELLAQGNLAHTTKSSW
jgi:ribosomal protein S14